MILRLFKLLVAPTLCTLLLSCDLNTIPNDENTGLTREELRRLGSGKLFGDAFTWGGSKEKEGGKAVGIGVNIFLWRATLDTLSFMPLSSADPFGGVIFTDWYSTPENPRERIKVQVYILDRQLRSDGLRVSVFRQTKNDTGTWINASVSERTLIDLENAILTRAREIRISSVAEQ